MRVALRWADGTRDHVDTFQVDDLAAEDAGHPGPEGVRDNGNGGLAPINADGSDFTARQMLRFVRASAKAALARAGDPRAAVFDTECLEALPGDDEPDPTDPAQPGT